MAHLESSPAAFRTAAITKAGGSPRAAPHRRSPLPCRQLQSHSHANDGKGKWVLEFELFVQQGPESGLCSI